MEKLTVRLKSNGPLLLKSDRLANPLAPETKAHKKLTSDTTLKKTDEGQLMIAKSEFLNSFYDDGDGVRLPTLNLRKSLIMGARKSKKGKDIEDGVIFIDETCEFQFNGPGEHEKLWEIPDFVDARAGVIGKSRIMIYRPRLNNWTMECNVVFDPSIINKEDLLRHWETAGMRCRIGDFRTLFGRYTVEEVMK